MNFSRSRRGRRLDPASIRLPIVALVDVVMFLLVYFMVAGTLGMEEAELASALRTERGKSPSAADLQPQVVTVEMSGGRARFRVGARVLEDRAALAAVLEQLSQEAGVVVKANGDAPVAATAAALQACRDAGFRRVSFVPVE